MTLGKDQLTQAIAPLPSPEGGTLASSEALVRVAACDNAVSVRLSLEAASQQARRELAGLVIHTVEDLAQTNGEAIASLVVEFVDHDGDVIDRVDAARRGAPAREAPVREPGEPAGAGETLPGVKHVVAVGAGKGGVGKSTVAVNLAVGLARAGHAVGLLDGDIYGPSLPTMLGLKALDQQAIGGRLQPFLVHGVKAVTMGKLVEPDKPLIWRGPMAHGAFNQLVTRTDWGELDYLIVDLPPGTGDVPLTLAQSLSLAGAVIVCTPQRVAQDDAVRAVGMFNQLGVDVIGVVENMSYFVGDPDEQGRTKVYDLFGRGGAEQMAQRLGLPFLGSVPINTALRTNGDEGEPTKNFDPAGAGGEQLPRALENMVRQFESQIALASVRSGRSRPSLSIS